MIGIIFRYATDYIEIRVDGINIYFRTSQTGSMFATIDNIKLDKSGVIKEFPDLKDSEFWWAEAIHRFKEKIKSFNTENQRAKYIINDLTKYGYIPISKQRVGFRVEKL